MKHDIMYENAPKVVVIGGGTGLSILLRGLKRVTPNITAIVTMADDGGGSGVLREDLGMLPPGDIRNCILALSNVEPLMGELLQYRFSEGRLKGQNFGNLLIAAMVGISDSFEEAIRHMNEILAVTGKVVPVTTEDVVLSARLADGSLIQGESEIPYQALKRKSPIKQVFVQPDQAKAFPEALRDIAEADVVILGPGSLFTSIIPNILIREIDEALASTTAKVVYIANIMTQPGETDGFSLRDHMEAFNAHSAHRYIGHVVANNGLVPQEILGKYEKEGSSPILATDEDKAYLESMGITLIEDDFTEVKVGYLRHDAYKVSSRIVSLVERVWKKS